MNDILSIGHPLAYKALVNASAPDEFDNHSERLCVRSKVRALDGMQKETLVHYGPTGTVWRMVSDEGPYLNGTDLAPFPLAFYSTGMALSFTEQFIEHAKSRGIAFSDYVLTQDNFYTMEGSAIQGTMLGGALPAELNIALSTEAEPDTIRELVVLAEKTSPAQDYMRGKLANTFALSHNQKALSPRDVNSSEYDLFPEPTTELVSAQPLASKTFEKDIIVKVESAETLFDVEGGAGSSLKSTQKRTLHVRAICTLREDGLKAVKVQLFKPIGSTFRFLSDSSEGERAPSSLTYLSAGIGFCFMTQIGRYAHIMKHDLKQYSITQDTAFTIGDAHAEAFPVDTHTYLVSGEDDDTARQTLYMSERTCFLHAAMRGEVPSQFTLMINGQQQ